jgi:hypothetical protein
MLADPYPDSVDTSAISDSVARKVAVDVWLPLNEIRSFIRDAPGGAVHTSEIQYQLFVVGAAFTFVL